MLDKLKKTPTQTPTKVTIPKDEKAPTGQVVVTETEVIGVVRTRSSNIIERVGWTAVQAFVGAFGAVFFATQELGIDALKAAGIAGGSAVLAALAALVKNLITTRLEG